MHFKIDDNKNQDNLGSLIKFYKSLLSQGPLGTAIKKEKTSELISFLETSAKKISSGGCNVRR
tara:strand:+ start:1295 stop:1483 length:189 start_codon:yes stop_codon:yes gene_type:complete